MSCSICEVLRVRMIAVVLCLRLPHIFTILSYPERKQILCFPRLFQKGEIPTKKRNFYNNSFSKKKTALKLSCDLLLKGVLKHLIFSSFFGWKSYALLFFLESLGMYRKSRRILSTLHILLCNRV